HVREMDFLSLTSGKISSPNLIQLRERATDLLLAELRDDASAAYNDWKTSYWGSGDAEVDL
ncbi:MAG: hypothetical protein KDI36_19450, partial [Pseudomonadales bacterium]|nr:hypothetical protein [Pseudomonadales bacterium]